MSISKLTNSGLSGDKYPNLMADNTFMEPIATTLVGSGGATDITFSNIPQNYKHLQIRTILKRSGGTAADNTNIRLNGDTGSNYAWHQLLGNGSSALAGAGTSATFMQVIHSDSTANVFGAGIIDFLDYTNQNKYKTVRTLAGWDDNTVNGYMIFRSGLWMNTSAITSIKLIPNTGTFAQYSRFSLYGIRG